MENNQGKDEKGKILQREGTWERSLTEENSCLDNDCIDFRWIGFSLLYFANSFLLHTCSYAHMQLFI